MRKIHAFVSERFGIEPESIGLKAFEAIVRENMRRRGMDDASAYLNELLVSPAEVDLLRRSLAIPETWFFREEGAFQLLKKFVADEWWISRPRRPLRALSLPCSSGEEPASIAMTLLDAGLAPRTGFIVDAVDLRPDALAAASRGVYSSRAFRGSDVRFRARHFDEREEGPTLKREVLAGTRFVRGDVLDAGLLEGETPYDIVFCRNLLIYLNTDARRQAMRTFARLLAPTGILFTGSAEVGLWGDAHVPVPEARTFALRRRAPSPPPVAASSAKVAAAQPLSSARMPVAAPARRVAPPAKPVREQAPPPAPAPARAHVASDARMSKLDRARRLADSGKLDEAARMCVEHLAEAGDGAEAHFLLGVIHDAASRVALAEESFRKALYLDPHHYEAMVCLALVRERRGDAQGAALLRERARRATAKGP